MPFCSHARLSYILIQSYKCLCKVCHLQCIHNICARSICNLQRRKEKVWTCIGQWCSPKFPVYFEIPMTRSEMYDNTHYFTWKVYTSDQNKSLPAHRVHLQVYTLYKKSKNVQVGHTFQSNVSGGWTVCVLSLLLYIKYLRLTPRWGRYMMSCNRRRLH